MLAAVPRPAAWLLVALWTALVFELMTGERVRPEPWYWFMPYLYNLSHAVLFGLQAALLDRALRRGSGDGEPSAGGPAVPWLGAALLAVAYGAALEWHQGSLPGRVADGWDVVTDAVGAFGVPWGFAKPSAQVRRGAVVFVVALAAAVAAT